MQDDIPEEHLVAEMVQYGKERLEAAGYVPYYLYRQQYMRGAVREYRLYLPGKHANTIFQIMERATKHSIHWGQEARLSGCAPLNIGN